MKILVCNQLWFVDEWRAAGHEVVSCGLRNDMDVRFSNPLLHIDSVLDLIPGRFQPDVIVYFDNSMPICISGLDETEIPTLFYSVDAHHHVDVHKHLGLVFDKVLVAHRDYLDEFIKTGCDAIWLPLWATKYYEPSLDKQHKVVFVGNLDPKLNPERVQFLEELQKHVDIVFKMGEYWKIFPHSEIVLNQTAKSDLNFRVFEGMMSGSLLLSEKSSNGLLDLFKEDFHLASYTRNNVIECADLINSYLADIPRCRRIGEQGRAEILAKHTSQHRADFVIEIIKDLKKVRGKPKFFASMINLFLVCNRFEEIDLGFSRRAIVACLKAAENALRYDEIINDQASAYVVLSCLKYEMLMRTGSAEKLLYQFAESYPDSQIIFLAIIRSMLNSGKIAEARAYAYKHQYKFEDVCYLAEDAITNLIAGLYVR